ncbi:phosphate transport regulator [Trinickia sp. NRRL B-1857]|uniref:phosphate transport regulator n=1 Tax=Trinickia sp. NRRL B-1857 TaxID=3162879 RepID=UPI003D2DDCB0
MTQKTQAIAAMGQRSLLLPGWIKAALSANDRLKLYLTVLQVAFAHAEHPDGELPDLSTELVAAHVDAPWLRNIPTSASLVDGTLLVPDLPRLMPRFAEDLETMARPLVEPDDRRDTLRARVQHWLEEIDALRGEGLSRPQLQSLTRGRLTNGEDSLHLLVMDLHHALNQLAKTISGEEIDGAHVWHLHPADRARVVAFMRGLNRTAPLKFDHPGLDTAATRDGERLLLQNDIGTNDVHVLVVAVEDLTITLSYSDLHRSRFEFFQSLLVPYGAQWSDLQSKVNAALNEGEAYIFGVARFDCADERTLETTLEGIGSRIVFLIDWNRARKRLLSFVDKDNAIEVLRDAARCDAGHMAWLKAGGEALIYTAMQAVGQGAFRIGDRLDTVLGAADARAFMVEVLRMASHALLGGQPVALVADQTRLLLARRVRQHSSAYELLEEHAAYCHALAQAVSDGLTHDVMSVSLAGGSPRQALAVRAKAWERQADHLVMRAREQAQRQPRWQPFKRLLELSDDIADALEEAAFLMSLIADGHQQGWDSNVHDSLARLAQTVLMATQEHVKSLAIARCLGNASDTIDSDAFLAASWNVLRSERQCDELLRAARRAILAVLRDAPSLMLANDLATTLELASDRLLVAGYALRDVALGESGANT